MKDFAEETFASNFIATTAYFRKVKQFGRYNILAQFINSLYIFPTRIYHYIIYVNV